VDTQGAVPVPEASKRATESGLVPEGEGWFVVNARDAVWWHTDALGSACMFEGDDARFPQLGINVNVMQPGQPSSMYHRENRQEDFLVVSGEAVLIVEGHERPLKAWDFVHCPAETDHVIVGAGSGPCIFIAVGARGPGGRVHYPVSDVAQKRGAGAEEATDEPKQAYARFERPAQGPYRDGDLPG
jgi:uncharacterized cupin superfamily protein